MFQLHIFALIILMPLMQKISFTNFQCLVFIFHILIWQVRSRISSNFVFLIFSSITILIKIQLLIVKLLLQMNFKNVEFENWKLFFSLVFLISLRKLKLKLKVQTVEFSNREKVEFTEAFRGFCFSRLFHIYFRNLKKVGKKQFHFVTSKHTLLHRFQEFFYIIYPY